MGFDFDSETRRQLGYRLIDRINEYFASLPDRPVQLPAEQRTFGNLSNQLPEFAEDAAKVLDDVSQELIAQGFHVPSANYFGLMNPAPTYIAVLAEALVSALNPQLATMARSQLPQRLKRKQFAGLASASAGQESSTGLLPVAVTKPTSAAS